MIEYPKIQGLFKRDKDTHKFIEDQWTYPEFEFLKYNLWQVTEKIDGTNIRIMWKDGKLSFGGRTDKAEIPKPLMEKLVKKFPEELFLAHFDTTDVCLYGEGFGAGIQSGGWYIPDGVDYILFDVFIEGWWLKWEDVRDIANTMEIQHVPDLGMMSLSSAIALIKGGTLKSAIGDDSRLAEGIVCRNPHGLLLRNGRRLITKIKHCDWKE